MNKTQKLYHTLNLTVADILLTLGFKLETFTHIVRSDNKESKEFWFAAESDKCEFQADKVAHYATKGARELEAINPEHPILWIKAALENRNQLIDIIKKSPRMVTIYNGEKTALIAETASAETRRQVAELLN